MAKDRDAKQASDGAPGADMRPGWARLHVWQIQWVRDLLVMGAIAALFLLGERLALLTVPALLAVMLAHFLEPAVQWIRGRFQFSRHRAATLVFMGALLLAGAPLLLGAGFGLLQGARVAVGLSRGSAAVVASVRAPGEVELAEAVPGAWRHVRDLVVEIRDRASGAELGEDEHLLDGLLEWTGAEPEELALLIERGLAWLRDHAGGIAESVFEGGGTAARVAVGTAGWLGTMLLGAFLTLFFLWVLLQGERRPVQRLLDLSPVEGRADLERVLARMQRAIDGFVRGRILIALILAVFYTVGFAAIGVPAPLLAGAGVSLLALVPYATLAALPVLMVLMALEGGTGIQGTWWWILLAPTAIYQVGQALDDYLLTPRIQGPSTDLSTPAIVVASLAGGLLAGFYGLLLAIPVAACGRIALEEWVLPRMRAFAEGRAKDPLPLGDGSNAPGS